MPWKDDHDDFGPDEYGDNDVFVLAFERVKAETKKAWFVIFESDGLEIVEAWLPKSECVLNTQKSEIEVPSWLVYEKELEKYEKEGIENENARHRFYPHTRSRGCLHGWRSS